MVTPSSDPLPMRLAAIDIGTNSIRCVVAETDGDGSYRVLDEEREMTRLGHDLFQRGRLAAEPAWVTEARGGAGFAELAVRILEAR